MMKFSSSQALERIVWKLMVIFFYEKKFSSLQGRLKLFSSSILEWEYDERNAFHAVLTGRLRTKTLSRVMEKKNLQNMKFLLHSRQQSFLGYNFPPIFHASIFFMCMHTCSICLLISDWIGRVDGERRETIHKKKNILAPLQTNEI